VATRETEIPPHGKGKTKDLSKLCQFNAGINERNQTMKHVYRAVAGLVIALLCVPAPGTAQAKPDKPEVAKRVNINSADSSQLTMLPRVGPSVADRIVEYRKDNGPFKKPEDLMLVQGIGEKTFQLIKPYLATSGDTTLKEKVGSSRSGSGKAKGAKAGKAKKAKTVSPSAGSVGRVPTGKVARPSTGKAAKKAAKGKNRRNPSGERW
jgi:competence protein ComEA